MPTHGGQVAFVGGHKTASEIDPWEVAQREFEEETAHSRSCLEFLGYLPLVMTGSAQPIVPVMAKLNLPLELFLQEIKSNGEWDDVIAYPWRELTQEKNWEFAWRHGYAKSPVMFHAIRGGSYFHLLNNSSFHLLWGATAQMIWNFLRLYFK
jgi:8-oxo-dGTP pyrophosphatase MutT (NUDIX family)